MRYPLENQEIDLGEVTVKINGFANYEIDCGFARFTKVKILDHSFVPSTDEQAHQGLTKDDLTAIQDSILDNLNENYELCDYLASDNANGF